MRSSRRGQGSVTIQDVARAAGVSAMTVSRVVNGNSNVREATRTTVTQAIAELRYRPNAAARTLAAGEATQIGLLHANPSAAYLSQLLIGALAGARDAGCHLVVEPCEGEDAAEQARATGAFVGAEVQGVILPPPLSESQAVRDTLATAGIAWVAIGPGRASDDGMTVRIDDFAAARAMTRHLIDLGHRDIAFVRGNPNQGASHERHRGFIAAITAAGLDADAMRVEPGDFTFRSGIAAAERLLRVDRRPTAIFASNDDMAAAAVGVAHRLGLSVPGDVSIVGFDDTALATNVWPELTTIRQPITTMAQTAATMLIAHLQRRGGDEEQVLPFELVIRDSCAPPRR
ncbi:MAG: LacI family DNA-binding transcriptional regulator [Pseudomonadota bacterium]